MRGCGTAEKARHNLATTTQVVDFEFFESCHFWRPQTHANGPSPKASNASLGGEDQVSSSTASFGRRLKANFFEGFDPGSERTLAAWIRHASRTNPSCCSNTVAGGSGERGSKAWVTYPGDRDSPSNEGVIPGDLTEGHLLVRR